jgi:uncharacterized SAM-binding protein YcdF (DUF218 family)
LRYIVVYGGSIDLKGNLSVDCQNRLEVGLAAALQLKPGTMLVYCVSKEWKFQFQLAKKSINYFLSNGWPENQLIWNPVGSNTLTETEGAIRVLENERTDEVTIVTHWYHIPRTRLCWKLLGWKGRIHFVPCQKTGNVIGSLFWEFLGFGKLLLLVLGRKVHLLKTA